MIAINKYPVFEADQVLSQNHLNSIVSYLESQDRATRKGLIGIGIVCGLEISFSNDGRSITIGNGVAVTSLGFQIDWKAKTFSNYKNVDKLSDNFLTTPVNNESYLNSIFRYNDYYKSDVFKNFDELIETENLENSLNFSASKMAATTIVDSGSPVQQSYPIKNTSFFNNTCQ